MPIPQAIAISLPATTAPRTGPGKVKSQDLSLLPDRRVSCQVLNKPADPVGGDARNTRAGLASQTEKSVTPTPLADLWRRLHPARAVLSAGHRAHGPAYCLPSFRMPLTLLAISGLAACGGGAATGVSTGIVQGDERVQPQFDEVFAGSTYSVGGAGGVEAIWGLIDDTPVALSRISSAAVGPELSENVSFAGRYIVVGGRTIDGVVDGTINGSGPISFTANLSENSLNSVRPVPFEFDLSIDGGTISGTVIYDTFLGEFPGEVQGLIGTDGVVGAMAGQSGNIDFAGGFGASPPPD